MLGTIDFFPSLPEIVTLFVAVLFPFVLILLSRIRRFHHRNALQLCVTTVLVFLVWIGGFFFIGFQNIYFSEMISSAMMFVVILLVYLEIWALLSRGYTWGILLTLAKSPLPLSEQEISRLYRVGQGLEWLVHHRFSSLFAARLIVKRGDSVSLTPLLGKTVTTVYKLFISLFSLEKTG